MPVRPGTERAIRRKVISRTRGPHLGLRGQDARPYRIADRSNFVCARYPAGVCKPSAGPAGVLGYTRPGSIGIRRRSSSTTKPVAEPIRKGSRNSFLNTDYLAARRARRVG